MNDIKKIPIKKLGYDFIPLDYIPEGKDEYYLRFEQQKTRISYRHLKLDEIEVLKQNGNTADSWTNVMVPDIFMPELVQRCAFFGLVRIGKLEPYYLEFHNLRRPVGLYNSTIISSDIGNNVVIDNVDFLSHYIIGNDVMIVNTAEIETTDRAKFGNGILKEGEKESVRIKLEVCNENGGRSIIPFDGMLPGDAWLWSRYRQDEVLQQKWLAFTEDLFDGRRGFYGTIGDRTVIKNCKIIKDVKIGSDAYIKGANKLKNLTINSSPTGKTQIGEGCEIVNGIIGFGCRVFYGVKAVRFILASHSQLKYGARLINSYLGNNATISCCEVLNSLIFPAHEQHHNNSFLCAALLMGQSNMAAGATVGSNHNSRSADGELIAGRGFWPGLCVSLKHNSSFASFIILAKGDFPAELKIPIPFSLVSNDVTRNELVVMPAYWFMHNMYGLARNAWKYADRDKRTEKIQLLEYDFLAPDSINEIVESIRLIALFTGRALLKKQSSPPDMSEAEIIQSGKQWLDAAAVSGDEPEIFASGFENSGRPVRIIKAARAYRIFRELVTHHAVNELIRQEPTHLSDIQQTISPTTRESWINAGGQLIRQSALQAMIDGIHAGSVNGWSAVHAFYQAQGQSYPQDKFLHAVTALREVHQTDLATASAETVIDLLRQSLQTREWLCQGVYDSRAKDYSNPFRQMVYGSVEEMDQVIGKLDDNPFIQFQQQSLQQYRQKIEARIKAWTS